MIGAFRIRASRDGYRRGGRTFAQRAWTEVTPADDLSAEALHRILTDPVLSIQVRRDDAWTALSLEDRHALASPLQALTDQELSEIRAAGEPLPPIGGGALAPELRTRIEDLGLDPDAADLIDQLVEAVETGDAADEAAKTRIGELEAALAAQTSGDGAAPPPAETESQGSAPETAGKSDQAGGEKEPPAKPAPKGGKKPAEKAD